MKIERQAGALGAYIRDVDLSKPIAPAEFAPLREAFLRHHVICFRGQELSPAEQLEFAARWGEIFVHPYVPSLEGYPGIMELGDPHPITTTWHSDTTHSKQPPRATILLGRQIPDYGGDTMFANQHLAYEAMSPRFRELLDGLYAVHKGTERAGSAGLSEREVTATHPVVRAHPDTRRKALFVNRNYTKHFEGMTPEESRPLLEFLFAHAGRAEFTWRHRWRPGDLLMWDNASVQHSVVGDLSNGARIMHRVTLAGETPR